MSWADDLIQACKNKNFDLSITLTQHSTGADLYSFTSNVTFDSYVMDMTAYPNYENPWWIIRHRKGRRPTIADMPVDVIASYKTQQEAEAYVHKGKRVTGIACWQTYAVAETTGDYFNKYVKSAIDS